MAATADLDLTLSQCRILFELERAGEDLPVNDLAARISLSIAATGRAIDSLYRSEVLTRREDEIDRRVKRIGLTSHGRSVIAKIMQVRRQGAERLVAALNDAERTALEQAVETISTLIAIHLPVMYESRGAT